MQSRRRLRAIAGGVSTTPQTKPRGLNIVSEGSLAADSRQRSRIARSCPKEHPLPHVPAEDRRRELIDAAIRVIGREGPAKATTRRIVAETDASLATLHFVFRDKQELFEAVINHCQTLTVERFRAQQPGKPGLAAATHSLLKEFADWARDGVEFHLAQYELLFWSIRTPTAHAFTSEIYLGYFRLFEEILAGCVVEGDDPSVIPQLARGIMAVADGMVLQIIALGDDGPTEMDVARYAAMALSGSVPRTECRSAVAER